MCGRCCSPIRLLCLKWWARAPLLTLWLLLPHQWSGSRTCYVQSVLCTLTWTGRWVKREAISCLSPGIILIRGNPSQSSAYPTGWWMQLFWPTWVRVCNHLWAREHTRLGAWPHPGPYSEEFLYRAYSMCELVLTSHFCSVLHAGRLCSVWGMSSFALLVRKE